MSKITDFLYSRDYAISVPEVLGYPTAFRGRETGCRSCDNLFRLLNLHLGIFHAARYIHLENLERLAILRFAQILTFCPLSVIRMAVDEVYSVEPHVWKTQIEDVYSLAEIVDYRERLVEGAVVHCVRQQLENTRLMAQRTGIWVENHDPALPFRSLGAKYPDFARHMRGWFTREFSSKTAGSR